MDSVSRNILKSWVEDDNDTVPARRATKEKIRSDSRENSSSRKKAKPNLKNESDQPSKPAKKVELETDPSTLQRRQKQVDYGKNTVGYHNYMQQVPIDQRTKDHPRTPDKYIKYSRRSWDMLIKLWRKKLHKYDTGAKCEPESRVCSSVSHGSFCQNIIMSDYNVEDSSEEAISVKKKSAGNV